MKKQTILVTGGAGFIGSFLTDKLISQGYAVRILDNLEKQVHQGKKPAYLNPKAEFVKGDVRDRKVFLQALRGIEMVFHLAARVGVGQSNYQIKDYSDTNIGGTANLLESIVNDKLPVKKIVTIASMTSYGEGTYQCAIHGMVKPDLRSVKQLKRNIWEPVCPTCEGPLIAIPTSEEAPINNNSMYSLTKNMQETMLLLFGKLYHIPVVSLRCFNVYGPRQSLSNPYTGVTAIFISRLKNNKRPVVYEDGKQTRDFVSVHDVVGALLLAMQNKEADFQAINIGMGKPTTIHEIAVLLARLLGKDITPNITGEFRLNDIRHCFADIAKAKNILGWKPTVTLERGLGELIEWSKKEHATDAFEHAEGELRKKKLL